MSEEAKETGKGRRSKKLVIIALATVLLGGGSAAGAWFALGRDAHSAPREERKAPKKQLFTTLEPFTVNLQDPRGERFAQVGIILQFEDPNVEVVLKDRLPRVRNDILLLIASKQMEELLSVEGKTKLAEEIRVRTVRAMELEPAHAASGAAAAPEGPIRGVLFTQFIVQ